MTELTEKALMALREAVHAELEHKAKLGYRAVICDKNGKPKALLASTILRNMRREEKLMQEVGQ